MDDIKVFYRLTLVAAIQNTLLFLFLLLSLILYGVLGYLLWMALDLVFVIPLPLWTGLILLAILTDLARYLTLRQKKNFQNRENFETLLGKIFWIVGGILLFLLVHLWIILKKFSFFRREIKVYMARILEYLFRQNKAVPIQELTTVIWEGVEKKSKFSSSEERDGKLEEVTRFLLKGLVALQKLKLVQCFWHLEEGQSSLWVKLNNRGEAFMLGFKIPADEE